MRKATILLAGAGGHARSCIDVIEQEGCFVVAGLTGLTAELGTSILGYPVLGTDTDVPALLARATHAIVAAGQIESPDLRRRLFLLLESAGFQQPAIISPRAYVSPHARVGSGTIVMHGAVVNSGAVVGRNCIVNSHALVEHDVVVGDHCHIATRAVLNGGAMVGGGTFVGSASCVKEGICIGANCVIGMGSVVLSDCPEGTRLQGRQGIRV